MTLEAVVTAAVDEQSFVDVQLVVAVVAVVVGVGGCGEEAIR
jgi:hypothetical protein